LAASDIELISVPGHDSSSIIEAVQGADAVFVYSAALSKDVLAQFGRCRLVVRCGTGYDLIDVDAARALGIALAYVPSYGEWDVAEHALALIFAVARRVSSLDLAVHRGQWPSYNDIGSLHRLHGATLGLLGFGRIGRCLAQTARAMGMVVYVCDPYLAEGEIERAGAVRCTIDGLAGVQMWCRFTCRFQRLQLASSVTISWGKFVRAQS
jgi:D-3-phosphoglycerate dehydrogenase